MAIQGYNNIQVGPIKNPAYQSGISSLIYRGFSTVSTDSVNGSLYDLALIKQDLINQFHIKKGEKLENPDFGTIIWDLLFEPLTEEVKSLIVNDVTTIINSDPRTQPVKTVVTQVDKGFQIEITLIYIPYNIQEKMQLTFDQANGIV